MVRQSDAADHVAFRQFDKMQEKPATYHQCDAWMSQKCHFPVVKSSAQD